LGAGLFFVRAVDEETIKKYIKNQEWDEQDQGFKITAPTEPGAGSQPGALEAALAATPTFRRNLILQALDSSH
jgi:hypothetical protein